MHRLPRIISAPSILGLRPTGVELLGSTLLDLGLAASLKITTPVTHIESRNEHYSPERDEHTQCLNPQELHDFSLRLIKELSLHLAAGTFPLVLGGDCSILLGILPALKQYGDYGLVFADAHADFYAPEQSTSGEVADMDLAIVAGRGPDILSNIIGMKPYVQERHVIHIGQRDEAQAKEYGSDEIADTMIRCFSLARLRSNGLEKALEEIVQCLAGMATKGSWLHFDTDVIADSENPAVDYRLPGGLTCDEIKQLLGGIAATGRITGMSVTIYNPKLDPGYEAGRKIVDCLGGIFEVTG